MADDADDMVSFEEMGLDDRILQAVAKLKWSKPTLIQEKAIPLVLEGKDILARAMTGSGKTGAFAIPCIQRILKDKEAECGLPERSCVRALVLAPTRELCEQLTSVFLSLTSFCSRIVRCVNVSSQRIADVTLLRPAEVLIGTPSKLLTHVRSGHVSVTDRLQMLAVDEADLMVSFGHGSDLRELAHRLPAFHQTMLLSATISENVLELRQLMLNSPVIMKLHEPQLPPRDQLAQYHIKIEEQDKFLLLYTLFKLKLIHGKTIIFVNKVDRCYRLRLFLEQFGVPSCALNSELPIESRCHIVGQFNEGVYDIIIASEERQEVMLDGLQNNPASGKRYRDQESGFARGIDFQFVSNVLNFDFPQDVDSYIHRAGRTARGGSSGSALSFVSIREQPLLHAVEAKLAEMFPAESREQLFRPYHACLDEMEGFRYRAKDAMRAVTKRAIREARIKEIKQEMFNCKQLNAFFEKNPRDLQLLRHDKALHTAKVHKHMKHVPEYIIPKALRRRAAVDSGKKSRRAQPSNNAVSVTKGAAFHNRNSLSSKDPLKTMEFAGLNEFV